MKEDLDQYGHQTLSIQVNSHLSTPSFDNVPHVNFPGKATVQFNLAVGFALREEWEKASNIVTQLYRDGQDVSVQVCHVPENCQIL